MTGSDWAAVQKWVDTSPGIMVADVLRIFGGGRVLGPEEAEEIKAEEADGAGIQQERDKCSSREGTWSRVLEPTPEAGTVCLDCGGNTVERTWSDHVDRGCHACGRAVSTRSPQNKTKPRAIR